MTEAHEAIPARHPAVASVELDGEAILYDERDGFVHVLNHTATLLWTCLGTDGRIQDLIADIADTYATSSATIEADVLATLDQFSEAGLLDDGMPWTPLLDEDLPAQTALPRRAAERLTEQG